MSEFEKIAGEVSVLMDYMEDQKYDAQFASSVVTSLLGNILLLVKQQDEKEFGLLKAEILKDVASVGLDTSNDYKGGLN